MTSTRHGLCMLQCRCIGREAASVLLQDANVIVLKAPPPPSPAPSGTAVQSATGTGSGSDHSSGAYLSLPIS